jgi:hypothetical protein
MNPLVALAIQETPALIALLRAGFVHAHPDQPEPTSEEVLAAYEAAFASSRAKDEAWLNIHPLD